MKDWKLKYIYEVKDEIVPFHKPVGEWNGTMRCSPSEYISTFMQI